jgi:hypothetical protein
MLSQNMEVHPLSGVICVRFEFVDVYRSVTKDVLCGSLGGFGFHAFGISFLGIFFAIRIFFLEINSTSFIIAYLIGLRMLALNIWVISHDAIIRGSLDHNRINTTICIIKYYLFCER